MCHTGLQYTPVASIATCVQPASVSHSDSSNSPAVVVANSRCSVVAFRPVAMRAHAFTHREWTSNPAHRGYMTSIPYLLYREALAWSPPVRNLEDALTGLSRCRNTGCSRDSGSNCSPGSVAPQQGRPLCQRHALHSTPVSSIRGSGAAGWRTAVEPRQPGGRPGLAAVSARAPTTIRSKPSARCSSVAQRRIRARPTSNAHPNVVPARDGAASRLAWRSNRHRPAPPSPRAPDEPSAALEWSLDGTPSSIRRRRPHRPAQPAVPSREGTPTGHDQHRRPARNPPG